MEKFNKQNKNKFMGLTSDDLRDLADTIDNPALLPKEFKSIKEYTERLSLK